jgi:GH15 family glucan-1,4-alpha-glucosidase
MALRLEDYGLIGDTRSAALVGFVGSIDWLCLPRFDSGACLAALLGDREHGRWLLAPAGGHRASGRRYRPDTLVLETEFTTAEGAVRVVDRMPAPHERPDVFRRVEGLSGRVPMRSELVLRLDCGHVVPWVREVGRRTSAFAGPDLLTLDADVPHGCAGDDVVAEFEIGAGEHAEFRVDPAGPASRTRRRR